MLLVSKSTKRCLPVNVLLLGETDEDCTQKPNEERVLKEEVWFELEYFELNRET